MNNLNSGIIDGIFIISMLLLFIATVFWAWSNKRKPVFDAAAKLPLEDETKTSTLREEKP